MAALVQDKGFKTFSVSTAGDTLVTGSKYCRLRNLGAQVVSVSDAANPTGAATAGDQSSLIPAASTGPIDSIQLRPYTTYYIRAAAGGPTLCSCDEVEAVRYG